MDNLGLIILHEGVEPIQADIVFVHGLGGHRIDTWQRDEVMWPRDLLKIKLPNV